ncbi:DNA polymerase III subunit theta [Pantoea sp. EKM21T]|uniref:DNA polymerase III subunit theta n=1 Tax=unclassified Pantoea TaxID=2630326 RepID=UPI00142DD170|nr:MULTISPECIES: DNA polymerase III subunit theta [unclassified Pantoea]KAF6676845.1 DNA polymerase III subunit theta [Pantoea sp. EKM21T]KAF6685993.1 DNA polymerase III subunit theta [Pantoea sp. EKM22T]
MSHNLAARSREDRDRINVDLAASGVAYKERMNQPVIAHEVEMQQPAAMREYFKERLQHYRNVALQFPRGTDPVYFKEDGK